MARIIPAKSADKQIKNLTTYRLETTHKPDSVLKHQAIKMYGEVEV
jgi:hypothetical protein